jgi:hypothetical protein
MFSVQSLIPPVFKTRCLHLTLYSQARIWQCYWQVYQWVMILTKSITLTAQIIMCFFLPPPPPPIHLLVHSWRIIVCCICCWWLSLGPPEGGHLDEIFRLRFYIIPKWGKSGGREISLWLHIYKESFKLFSFLFDVQDKLSCVSSHNGVE